MVQYRYTGISKTPWEEVTRNDMAFFVSSFLQTATNDIMLKPLQKLQKLYGIFIKNLTIHFPLMISFDKAAIVTAFN